MAILHGLPPPPNVNSAANVLLVIRAVHCALVIINSLTCYWCRALFPSNVAHTIKNLTPTYGGPKSFFVNGHDLSSSSEKYHTLQLGTALLTCGARKNMHVENKYSYYYW